MKDYLNSLILRLLLTNNGSSFYNIRKKLEKLNILLDKKTLINRIRRLNE